MTDDAVRFGWERRRLWPRREAMLRFVVHDDDRIAIGVVAVARMQRGANRQPDREHHKRAGRDPTPAIDERASHSNL